MYIPKRYGESRVDNCPFCGKIAVNKNRSGVPTCFEHRNSGLPDFKCACGKWLELCEGKWGPYFRCINCGNINFRKALEMNPPAKNPAVKANAPNEKGAIASRKEITVTSDQLDFLY